jgi:hypothetical protein
LKRCFKYRRRFQRFNSLLNNSKIRSESFYRSYFEHIQPVTSPLALISQIQRSGGSLLSQLFDGHPQIHAHPHEMMIGYKKKFIWPRLDLGDRPEQWFGVLFEKMIIEHARDGYKKGRRDKETFPFVLIPSLQRDIFLNYFDQIESISLRDVFDAYMTSYFGAWLNNQNCIGKKRVITAFTPRMSDRKENMELFFSIYPDGRLISLVRDPKNWYPSALRHVSDKYGNVEEALTQWNESVQAMLWNRGRFGDRVCILRFEDLISKTDVVMRHLADFLGIEFNNILLVPTFNKCPIKAHTSFKEENHGVVNSPLSRHRTLTPQDADTIDRLTRGTYSKILDEVVEFD